LAAGDDADTGDLSDAFGDHVGDGQVDGGEGAVVLGDGVRGVED
jgi:hypothetical protein